MLVLITALYLVGFGVNAVFAIAEYINWIIDTHNILDRKQFISSALYNLLMTILHIVLFPISTIICCLRDI